MSFSCWAPVLTPSHAPPPLPEVLLQHSACLLPNYEISELSAAVLSIFDDTAWLLYGGASDDVDAVGLPTDDPPTALLGLETFNPPQQQHHSHNASAAAQQPEAALAPQAAGRAPAPAVREILPIEEHREKLMASVRGNQVTCIQGETGCGKSSMVSVGSSSSSSNPCSPAALPETFLIRRRVSAYVRVCVRVRRQL